MLVEEFARKHDMCDWGVELIKPYLKDTVHDWWNDEQRSHYGTGLLWLLAHVQFDKKRLVSCACEAAREVLPLVEKEADELNAAIDKVQSWVDGDAKKSDIAAVQQKAENRCLAAREADEINSIAWLAVEQLASSVDHPRGVAGVTSSIARAAEKAKKASFDETEAKFARLVRSRFTWAEVEPAINADVPSPHPRIKSVDEAVEEAEQIQTQFQEVVEDFERQSQELNATFQEAEVSGEVLNAVLQNEDFLGEEYYNEVQQEFARLDAVLADDAPAKPATAKKSRRNRLAI